MKRMHLVLGPPEKAKDWMEELVNHTVVANEMPLTTAFEKYGPLIRAELKPFLDRIEAL